MKKNYFLSLLVAIIFSGLSFSQDLVITGVFDGPLTGGTPKGVELYVLNDIQDLSIYGIGSANNGQGTDGQEFTFPAVAVTKGTYLYVASEEPQFTAFFGFAPDYNAGSTMGINGDDAIELFMNGSVIDLYGDINKSGSGEVWDYLDGWAYRKNGTGPSTIFSASDWTFSGINVFDGQTSNSTAATPFPSKSYTTTASSSPEISVGNAVTGLNYFFGNGPSTEKDFSVSGLNLTADIVITAPQDFEVSLTSGSGFGASVAISPSSGTVASTMIYVRLQSGLSVNSYTGDVSLTSTGATNKTVTLSGQVNPADPQFYYTEFLNNFTYTVVSGGPSSEQDFTVRGLFLTENLIVTAPANFEVSLTSGIGFSSSVSINPISGTIDDTTIYIRLVAGLSEGNYTGNVVISSTGVADKTFSISGNVFGEATRSMIITGVFDGPLTGGVPKGVEIFVLKDIPDLTKFGVSAINNATSSNGAAKYNFPVGSATAGTFIYVSSEEPGFTAFFGFAPTYVSATVAVNGDDSFELVENGQIIDVFGEVDKDGSGLSWDYLDGWAYRKSNTGPEGTTFTDTNWTYSGVDAFDGTTTNGTATTPFPIGTYTNATASVKNNTIKGFATYPNPVTSDNVTITSNSAENKQVVIFNVLGKKVVSTNFTGTKSDINVANLASGIYILKVTEGTKTATSKLII
ncbi:MAG: hypothetical protein ABS28_02155, partial [Cryomorphaceae bacterium BACL22 MAG-120619-bin32]